MAKAEKITCEVFRVSGLSIKHSVTFGTKAQDGSRRNAISYFNYKSNKYTNESELATYTINTCSLSSLSFPIFSNMVVDVSSG